MHILKRYDFDRAIVWICYYSLCLVPHIALAVVFWGAQGDGLALWSFLFDIIQILWNIYGCLWRPILLPFRYGRLCKREWQIFIICYYSLCLFPHITLAVVFWGPQGNCLAEWSFLFDIIQILWDTPTYGCQRQPIYFIFQAWKVMQKGAIQNDIPKRWEIGWQSQPYEQVTKGEKNQKKIGMP